MKTDKIGKVVDFTADLKPIINEIDGTSIAVYRFQNRYFAYVNQCPHQGGPSCEGIVLPKVQCKILEGGSFEEIVSSEQYIIVCPWHGVEFDLESGVCLADTRLRLKKYEAFAEGEDVLIRK
ncbi:MAG: Rieske 2Fe-2S domain-containing protein [Thaumarchaeota archaeon]|nr:Rieske 2Fe-2S domain-containing protein [Nitrososphaerota archaeon]